MNLLDRIAEEFSYLLKDIKVASDNEQEILSCTIDEPIETKSVNKTASSPFFERVFQGMDEDCHQSDETNDFWQIKQGKLIRVVPKIVKG